MNRDKLPRPQGVVEVPYKKTGGVRDAASPRTNGRLLTSTDELPSIAVR